MEKEDENGCDRSKEPAVGRNVKRFCRTECPGQTLRALQQDGREEPEDHNQALKQFHRFLIENGKPTQLGELGEVQVREFILHLQERRKWQDNPYVLNHKGRLAAISVQTYVRALRAFFNWLYKEGYTGDDFFFVIFLQILDRPIL